MSGGLMLRHTRRWPSARATSGAGAGVDRPGRQSPTAHGRYRAGLPVCHRVRRDPTLRLDAALLSALRRSGRATRDRPAMKRVATLGATMVLAMVGCGPSGPHPTSQMASHVAVTHEPSGGKVTPTGRSTPAITRLDG